MALASLCREVTYAQFESLNLPDTLRTNASFNAFIVDHKIRPGSNLEAERVAAELERFGIEPHILKLDWKAYGDPSLLTNIESVARRLRYQALGRACNQRGINSLLVAHHRDDQAETVLSRLLSGYHGTGLRGMTFEAAVPECAGIYGVDQSGDEAETGPNNAQRDSKSPILIESGGVKIFRPLLPYDKEELVALCRQNGVRWFEDKTNADHTLTLRNTVRSLLKTEDLPTALHKPRLLELAGQATQNASALKERAGVAFNAIPLSLRLSTGEVSFALPDGLERRMEDEVALCTALLRRLLTLITPKSIVPMQDIDRAADLVFGNAMSASQSGIGGVPKEVQVAGVSVCRTLSEDRSKFLLRRSMPTKRERSYGTVTFSPQTTKSRESYDLRWSEWRLWDGRYWIRVCPPSSYLTSDTTITVRFLCTDDMEDLRLSVRKNDGKRLESLLALAKGQTRFTLPAIVAKRPGRDQVNEVSAEEVVALPSLGWSAVGWRRTCGVPGDDCWSWDIRYKHVDLNLADGASSIAPSSASSRGSTSTTNIKKRRSTTATGRRSPNVVIPETTILSVPPEEPRRSQRYTPLFTLAAGVSAAYFLHAAAGTCPTTGHTSQLNKAQCLLGTLFAVLLGLVVAFSVFGIIKHGETIERDVSIT
ncbi:hypothetical protein LTR37_006632 [Vermiconidia calcicola]|uniref:Uncharacterized protein n=1 Tax=Vermiconidia calcicola TaxID=1690605 RepID=A0ACC3NGH7_9PEZI|nr:hypothetical protein LTR37_006632 [Vermiconidia calcicola]